MSIFWFKQFSVQNKESAMKVNTDSVLLGAWSEIPKNAIHGLDIGSGTGLLALMLAQRNANLKIFGIEIEKNAFEESKTNFKNSPWKNRLKAEHVSLQQYVPKSKFDVIICNPPFFINDLKSSNKQKNFARHSDSLSQKEIITFVENRLTSNGIFSLILPKLESEIFLEQIIDSKLNLIKIANIKPNKEKKVNRIMMSFGLDSKFIKEETFCVYQEKGIYSERHKQLTCEFYLNN